MRTIVDIPDEQLQQLQRLCERDGISRAEAVRRSVALYVAEEQKKRKRFEDALNAVFGLWKDMDIDAVEYQRKIRAEWDRED